MSGPLGRMEPTDRRHVEKYRLTAETIPETPVPVIMGTNWYAGMDRPVKDRTGYWYIPDGDMGLVRGGHAYCLTPAATKDLASWWAWFDQGQEGACVGFAAARMMTLFNRRRYAGREIYIAARRVDEWEGEAYEGTSVRAGLDVLRERGPLRVFKDRPYGPFPEDGISRNRWATSVDEIVAAMHSPHYLKAGRVPLVNSWGRSYPHHTWISLDLLGRLLAEGGEAGLVTDR